uniref:Uncharacterized protein n=1 Tax=viral metagenome TaxID=1070528 RepID=A0A6M3J195_9ZZZZ
MKGERKGIMTEEKKEKNEKANNPESNDAKARRARDEGEERRSPTGRKARVPLGTPRARLTVGFKIPPDKKPRWIVDHPGRLAQAEGGGYTFVEDPNATVGEGPENQRDRLSTKISRVVGETNEGAPIKAYLMLINKDWYEEDQEVKQTEIDETDEAIRSGGVQGKVGDDGRYIPAGGITYKP